LAISRSIITAFERSVVSSAGQAQLQVSNGSAGVSADLIDDLQGVSGVLVASGTVQFELLLPSLDQRVTVFGVLLGADHSYRELQFGKDFLHLSDPTTFLVNADSIALPKGLLEAGGWSLGSTIDVVGPKGRQGLTVRGTLNPRGALSVFGGKVAVMDSEAAQLAFGELDRYDWIDLVIAPQADLEAVRTSIERLVAGRGVVETPFGRGRRMETMLGTLRWMLTASGTAAMLVGVFLIQHTIATSVRRRQTELAALRAIGATRRSVVLAILAESLAVGLIGSLAGIGIGVGFAALAVRAFGDVVGAMYASFPTPAVTLTRNEMLASLGIGIGAVLIAALIPSLRVIGIRPGLVASSAMPVVTPLSPSRPAMASILVIGFGLAVAHAAGALGFAGGVAAIALFTGSMFLGGTLAVPTVLSVLTPLLGRLLRWRWQSLGNWVWQQILRHSYHTVSTIGALAAAVAFTVGLTTLLGSYRDAIAPWVAQTLAADVFVTAGARLSLLDGPLVDPVLIRKLEDIDGVRRVMIWRFVEVQFQGRPIIVQAAADELIRRWHGDYYERQKPDTVVISETLAERYEIDVGSTLEIPAPLKPLELTVGAVRPDYLLDLGSVTIPWSSFVAHFGASGANILCIDKEDGTSSAELKHQIEAAAKGYDVTVLATTELREMTDAMIDQSFALTTALQVLAVLVTVLAMINATSAAILDRTNDLAIWRAIGLERSRLVGLLAVDACVMGLLAGVIGVASGLVFGRTLVRVVAPDVAGFRLPLDWPIGWALAALVSTAFFASLTAWGVAQTAIPRPITLQHRRL
jgi:putative ABC transport system permease protein